MTLPAMHGWTHRPKAQGGTDPIEIQLAQWARVQRYTAQSIPDSSVTSIQWTMFSTNAPSIFGTIASGSSGPFNNTSGDTTVLCPSVGGVFIVKALAQFDTIESIFEHWGKPEAGNIAATQYDGIPGPAHTAETYNSVEFMLGSDLSLGVGGTMLGVSSPFQYTAGPFFTMKVFQSSGAALDMQEASMTIFRLPCEGDADTDPRVYGSAL